MKKLTRTAFGALAFALLGSLAFAQSSAAGRPPPPHAWRATADSERYSLAVAGVCAGAMLFEHAHSIGTDAGALAAAQDIRKSARRRLDRVAAIPRSPEIEHLAARWIALQRRLAESYAVNWVRIHNAIDAASSPGRRKRLVDRLERYIHAPDPLRHASGVLELALAVPDCTGGGSNVPAGATAPRGDELGA
jgi:hypothetical protein